MAKFNKDKAVSPWAALATAVDTALATNQFAMGGQTVQTMVSFESIDAESPKALELEGTEKSVLAHLSQIGFDKQLMKHIGVESVDHPCVAAGMDAAAMTILAQQDPAGYMAAVTNVKKAPEGVTVFREPGAVDVSLEGYDDFKFEGFVGTAVVANALAAASSPFSELFFRTVVLAPSQSGVDVTITNPLVYTRQPRNANGSAYDLVKQSAVRALIDASILAGHATKILPIATTAKAGILVSASDVANRDAVIAGKTVQVRPLVYGKDIDLIAASTTEELLVAGAQDETDTLDPAVSLGTHYLKLTNALDSAVVAVNLDGMAGALFALTQEGGTKDQLVYFKGKVVLTSDMLTVAGASLESALNLATVIGGTASDSWRVEVDLDISGTLAYVRGNIRVNFNGAAVAAGYLNGVALTASPQAALVSALAVAGIGYEPTATRSNSNMRDLGTIIDVNDSINGRIPARMQSPLSVIAPNSVQGGTATMEAVNMIRRVRASNQAIDKLMAFEKQLLTSTGIEGASPSIGAMAGVKPTLITRTLNVNTKVVQFGSNQSMLDLQGAIAAAVNTTTNQLLLDSGYLASIEMFTGSQSNFEVIVGTDPQIESLLMTSGDNRVLGNGRNYKVASSLDSRLRGKIYVSVRRTDVDGASAHCFGVHPIMPSLIHKATVSRGGSSSTETIVIPREDFAVTCPVLAVINVVGLDSIFTGA